MERFGEALEISIHALREEGDRRGRHEAVKVCISIHALREEGDKGCVFSFAYLGRFLSTPSARRATDFA